MAKSYADQLLGLFADEFALQRRISKQVERTYPLHCRVIYMWGGNSIAGTVERHGSRNRIYVRNQRTGKGRWVECGTYRLPTRTDL